MHYDIKAYRAAEGITRLQLAAPDEADALRQARAQGYHVIALRRAAGARRWGWRRPGFAVALFTQELLSLLEAGLSLAEAIGLLARKARQAEARRVLELLARRLQEGLSLSQALQAMPDAFPEIYVATLRSAEKTGNLAEAMQRYLDYHRQLNQVRDKVVAASVYPALLMGAGMLVILFLLAYVVPRFSLVYEDLGDELPWMSRLLMQWGQFFDRHALLIFGVFATLALSLAHGLTRPGTRAAIGRALWSVPALGEKMRLYQLARFTRTLAMLVMGGVPFVAALDMVAGLLRQPALRQAGSAAAEAIRQGKPVSEAFGASQLATEVGLRLIAVGERSGELGLALERIAKLYDEDIARWIDWFTRLFEPVLMMGIGLVIGLIVLLMYLPIFELASSIQ